MRSLPSSCATAVKSTFSKADLCCGALSAVAWSVDWATMLYAVCECVYTYLGCVSKSNQGELEVLNRKVTLSSWNL